MWGGWAGGFFVWFVPFAVSCLVIKPDENGNMVRLLDEETFHTLMLFCGSSASAFAIYKCFPTTLKAGMWLGFQFLLINWFLDLLVLVPLMAQEAIGQEKLTFGAWTATVPHWFRKIGAGYVGFVLICPAAGAIAEQAAATAVSARDKNTKIH